MRSGHTIKRTLSIIVVLLFVALAGGCKADPTVQPTSTKAPATEAPTLAATSLPEATPMPAETRGYPLPSDGVSPTQMAYPLPMDGATMTPVAYPTPGN